MSKIDNAPEQGPKVYGIQHLLAPRSLGALVLIGAVVGCVAGAFAYTAGWLSPRRLTPTRIVDQFERTNGPHPGFRRNHAKGVCFTGWFDSDGTGARLSKAAVFQAGRTPVFGRFALAGGAPFMADGPTAVRSMAVNFALKDGEIWRTGMNDIPVFPLRDARDFYDQLVATEPDPRTGAPDPARVKAFTAAHPATARAMALIKAQPFSSGFADAAYNSLNAFRFVSANGRVTPVRWAMAPEDAFQPDAPTPEQLKDTNYLFDGLAARLRAGPVRWRLVATIGQPADRTDDATTPWPSDREHVQLGVLTIAQLADEAAGPCRDVTFDPLILPAGIAASDDPLLGARSATYASSFVRRSGESKPPGAVRLPAQAEGGR